MERIYQYENGIIVVTLPESCDREKLKRVTEDFLKKVINGGIQHGNTSTSSHIREK